jgi:Flp pilus assembly protein TadG
MGRAMIKHAFKGLWNDRRGNVLVLAGMTMPILMGAAGLATDTIQWTLWKRQLQRAADGAAIAGAYQRIRDNTEPAVKAAVLEDVNPTSTARMTFARRTGLELMTGSPATVLLTDSGSMRFRVQVTLRTQRSLVFSSMFLEEPPIITAVAVAAGVPGAAEYCVIGLDPSATATGIEVGGSSNVDMGECSMIANSRNPNKAAYNNGVGSTVKANSLAAAGGVQYSSSWNIKNYYPSSPPVADPLASLPIPAPASCQKNITISSGPNSVIDRSTAATGDAGQVVCVTGGLDIKGQVTLGAGTYVFNGGNISMNSNGTMLKCSGCTIILTNVANPALTGNISLTGGTVDLAGPTSGTYQGVAIYQDRRATDDGSTSANKINGNSSSGVVGAIYTPNRSLLYNGGGGLAARCVQVIAKRVTFSGNSNIKLSSECGTKVPGTIGGGMVVRLVA